MDPADVLTIVLAIGVPLGLVALELRYRRLWRMQQRRLDALTATDARADGSRELMNAVNSIAIEVERLSENQRYLTKVLAQGEKAPASGSTKAK